MKWTPILSFFFLGLSGCSRGPITPNAPPATRIVHGHTGQDVALEEVIEDLLSAKVIYVAENHDQASHHEIQLTVLQALAPKLPGVGLGMEMFQTPFQETLDQYLSNKIGEIELLRKAQWNTRWGFSWNLYSAIVRYAKTKQIPIVALNTPSELTKAVSKKGLEGLSVEEKAQLPEMVLSDSQYKDYVHKAFEKHKIPESHFPSFFAAQVLWDETMAQATVNYMRNEKQIRPIIVLAGTGHLIQRMGIPSRVQRRIKTIDRVVLPVKTSELSKYIDAQAGDWLWVTQDP